jgi:hypothetical protein
MFSVATVQGSSPSSLLNCFDIVVFMLCVMCVLILYIVLQIFAMKVKKSSTSSKKRCRSPVVKEEPVMPSAASSAASSVQEELGEPSAPPSSSWHEVSAVCGAVARNHGSLERTSKLISARGSKGIVKSSNGCLCVHVRIMKCNCVDHITHIAECKVRVRECL